MVPHSSSVTLLEGADANATPFVNDYQDVSPHSLEMREAYRIAHYIVPTSADSLHTQLR